MNPHAFLSDEIWDHGAGRAVPEDFAQPLADDTVAVPVSSGDLRRAPVVPLSPTQRRVPDDDPARTLAQATGPVRVSGALWPVAEGRLTTLVFLQGRGERSFPLIDDGTFDTCLTDATARQNGQTHAEALRDWQDVLDRIRRKRHSGEGIALFQCSVSGHVFGTYVLP